MNRISIPLNEIQVIDRQRHDLGDIESLCSSLTRYGLIQPIVISQEKRLIAGGRRLAAAKQLGWKAIDVCYRETLSDEELHELELEENIRRKDMTWQEQCRTVAKVHNLRVRRGALEGDFSWGQRQTGELLGLALGNVNYCLEIARHLDDEHKSPFWQCDSLAEAWRLRLRNEEDVILAEIARREKLSTNTKPQEEQAKKIVEEVRQLDSRPDLLAEERARYQANPLNTQPFDEYWLAKQRLADDAENTIYISNRFHNGDAIAFMNDPDNAQRFDHVVTDIPYAIDMDNLAQDGSGSGVDIDLVADEHDVEENIKLLQDFFYAAFKCTKDNAFVATWCDQDLWEMMKNYAEFAGFRVQRWPITWIKTNSCKNECAQYNFTKNTEIAMICRKPSATLAKPASSSTVTASNEEMRKTIGHPFAKPFECWQKIVEHVSIEGQTILEPFAGRGSGVISMLRMKRHVMAVELQVAHFNALLENVKTQFYLKLNPNYVFK